MEHGVEVFGGSGPLTALDLDLGKVDAGSGQTEGFADLGVEGASLLEGCFGAGKTSGLAKAGGERGPGCALCVGGFDLLGELSCGL